MIKNQVSREEARRAANDLKIHWRTWEKRIEGVLTANHYWWFHVPRMPTKALNQRFKAGLPDYIAIGKVGSPNEGRILVIEAKTGKGRQSAVQEMIVGAFLKVPGVSGGVFYPHDYLRLVKLAGGREPL